MSVFLLPFFSQLHVPSNIKQLSETLASDRAAAALKLKSPTSPGRSEAAVGKAMDADSSHADDADDEHHLQVHSSARVHTSVQVLSCAH